MKLEDIDFTGPDDETNIQYLHYMDLNTYVISSTNCYIWTGSYNRSNYLAQIRYKGKVVLLNRLILKLLAKEDVPSDKTIGMTCGNSLCCNLDHFTIEPKDTSYDSLKKIGVWENVTEEVIEKYRTSGYYIPKSWKQKTKIRFAETLSG